MGMVKDGKTKTILLRLLFLSLIGFALAFILQQLPLEGDELLKVLQNFSPAYLWIALCIVLSQITLQISRLWVLCPQAAGLSWAQAARAYVSGQFVSTFVQGQAGHAVKIAMVRKGQDARGRKIATAESTAIILVDKIISFVLLILLTLVAAQHLSVQLPQIHGAETHKIAVGGLLLVILLTVVLVGGLGRLPDKAKTWLKEFKSGLPVVRHPGGVFWGLVMALGDWISESMLLQVLCFAQGFALSYPQLIISLFILNLGISVPLSFANLGTFEAALTFGLTQMGVPVLPAIAIATVFHLFQMLGIALWMLANRHWFLKG